MHNSVIAFSAGCILMILAGDCSGETAEPLEKTIKAFEASKKDADKKMLRAFDKVIDNVRKDKRFPAETRSRYLKALEAEKQRFENSNDLPESDLMLGATFEYLGFVHAKRVLLQKAFEKALEAAIDNPAEFKTISAKKQLSDAQMASQDEFVSRSNWHGNRTFSQGSAVDFHLHVFEIDSNSFKGHIWQDVQSISGKSGWEFEGKIEGNAVTLTTTKMLHGGARRLDLRGFVIGRRLVFTALVNGKPAQDFVSVSKQ